MAEAAKKVMKKLKEEVEKTGLTMSVTENGKEGKSKMIVSCGFLEEELLQCSKGEGVTMASSVETLGVDFRKRVKRLGVKEKAGRKKCKVRFSLIMKNKVFQKDLHESWCQEVVASRHDTSKDLGSPRSWGGSQGEVKIEETDGSGRQKQHDFSVLVHGSMWSGRRRALCYGQSGRGNCTMNQEAWMKQIQEVQLWLLREQ